MEDYQLNRTNAALLRATLYINSDNIDPKELSSIETLLDLISVGKVRTVVSEKLKEVTDFRNSNKLYFKKNPHSKVVIVGDCRIKSQILVGMFQFYGIERKNLQTFTDFDRLKKIFPFTDVNSKNTAAILLGSVPHSVAGLNGYTSPKQAIESAVKKNNAVFLCSPDLKITKELIQEFINKVSLQLKSAVTK